MGTSSTKQRSIDPDQLDYPINFDLESFRRSRYSHNPPHRLDVEALIRQRLIHTRETATQPGHTLAAVEDQALFASIQLADKKSAAAVIAKLRRRLEKDSVVAWQSPEKTTRHILFGRSFKREVYDVNDGTCRALVAQWAQATNTVVRNMPHEIGHITDGIEVVYHNH